MICDLDCRKSYLSGSVQRVNVIGTRSSESAISMGVPRGPILGPFLFFIYINVLPSEMERT